MTDHKPCPWCGSEPEHRDEGAIVSFGCINDICAVKPRAERLAYMPSMKERHRTNMEHDWDAMQIREVS